MAQNWPKVAKNQPKTSRENITRKSYCLDLHSLRLTRSILSFHKTFYGIISHYYGKVCEWGQVTDLDMNTLFAYKWTLLRGRSVTSSKSFSIFSIEDLPRLQVVDYNLPPDNLEKFSYRNPWQVMYSCANVAFYPDFILKIFAFLSNFSDGPWHGKNLF